MRISTKLAVLGLLGGAVRIALEARRRQSAAAGAPSPSPAPPAPSRPQQPVTEAVGPSDPVETLVAQEESAAAAEAGAIGGSVPSQVDDPAMDPVYQAGGGEQEGFEAAEQGLIDAAQHGDSGADPLGDAFPGEAESDRSTAEYGDADDVKSTEQPDPGSP